MAKCAGLSIRVSPSHPYNAGRAGLGWGVGGSEEMCAMHAVMVLCFIFDEESFSKMFLSVSSRVVCVLHMAPATSCHQAFENTCRMCSL